MWFEILEDYFDRVEEYQPMEIEEEELTEGDEEPTINMDCEYITAYPEYLLIVDLVLEMFRKCG